MDANAVNQVIEKIVEKAGVAVDAVQPLAEQIIREYQAVNTGMAIACGVISVTGMLLFWRGGKWLWRKYGEADTNLHDTTGWELALGCNGFLAAIMTIVGFVQGTFEYLPRALAPTLYCLKDLLGS